MTPFFSIIIPVLNDAKNLNALLGSIFKNSFKDFEVIVVDDGSSDPEVKEVCAGYKVRYYRHETNRCVAAARNTGAKKAKGNILIFFDSDVLIEKDTVLRFALAYQEKELAFYQPLCSKRALNSGFGPELVALIWYFDYRNARRFSLHSQAFSIKKRVFFDHRGFDERFTGLGAEEFDLGYRLERSIELHSDTTHFLMQNYEAVLPRALSLFKRTVRYTPMFVFRTRAFEAQGGTPLAVFSALLAFLALLTGCLSPLLFNDTALFFAGPISLFLLHTIVNKNFFIFLKKEKGLSFSFKATLAVFVWSLATGTGIFCGLAWVTVMTMTGRKYESRLVDCR